MVRNCRILTAFIVMMLTALLVPAPAQAATVTPTGPPCVEVKLGWFHWGLDCTARNAYSDIAIDSVRYLRTPSGAAQVDRLAISVLGGAAGQNGTVRAALDHTRGLIYQAYNGRNYERASCIRTALLRTFVANAKGDENARQLANAVGMVSFIANRSPLVRNSPASMYLKVMNAAPKLAKSMSRYANSYNGGLDAMYC
jgi:hypothetical protein